MMYDLLYKVSERDEILCLSQPRENGFPTQYSCDRRSIPDIIVDDFYQNYSMLAFLFFGVFESEEETVNDEPFWMVISLDWECQELSC